MLSLFTYRDWAQPVLRKHSAEAAACVASYIAGKPRSEQDDVDALMREIEGGDGE